jgi:uncharacterized membrane protein YccC
LIPVAARRAFVAAFAATGGIWIAQAMQAPHGHWAAITALALVSPGADGTLRKTVFRIFGTVLAALTVIGLFGVGDPQPEWIIGGSLVMLAGAFLLGPHSPAPYAVLIWLGLGSAYVLIALDDPIGAPELVGWRSFHVAVTSLLVLVASFVARFHGQNAGDAEPPSRLATLDHALRIVLSAVLVIALAALLERPAWASSMVLSIVMLGVQPRSDTTLSKGLLRLSGALGGGAISLLYFVLLLDAATSIFSLLCVVFVVIWGCGLLLSSRSLAYLGVQIGLVFSWSIGDSLETSPDVWIALVRTAQVGLATAVFLAVQRLGWPRGLAISHGDARHAVEG